MSSPAKPGADGRAGLPGTPNPAAALIRRGAQPDPAAAGPTGLTCIKGRRRRWGKLMTVDPMTEGSSFPEWNMFATIRALAAGFSFVAAALPGGETRAQTPHAQTEAWCDGRGQVPDDVQISACTQMIKSGLYKAERLNMAHFYRGLTYAQTGRCRLAIPDFTAAIGYDPQDSDSYWSRHLCKQALGDSAGAAADRKAAKSIDPRIEEQWMQ